MTLKDKNYIFTRLEQTHKECVTKFSIQDFSKYVKNQIEDEKVSLKYKERLFRILDFLNKPESRDNDVFWDVVVIGLDSIVFQNFLKQAETEERIIMNEWDHYELEDD